MQIALVVGTSGSITLLWLGGFVVSHSANSFRVVDLLRNDSIFWEVANESSSIWDEKGLDSLVAEQRLRIQRGPEAALDEGFSFWGSTVKSQVDPELVGAWQLAADRGFVKGDAVPNNVWLLCLHETFHEQETAILRRLRVLEEVKQLHLTNYRLSKTCYETNSLQLQLDLNMELFLKGCLFGLSTAMITLPGPMVLNAFGAFASVLIAMQGWFFNRKVGPL
jgi:hypothetical protein